MTTHTEPSLGEQVEALAGRVFESGLGALELYTMHFGRELGLYQAMDEAGAQSVGELAERCGLAHRYVREWLQSQLISGFVTIDGSDPDTGRYRLAPGVRETLIDETNPAFVGGIPGILPTVGAVMPRLLSAFRTGEGVPYTAYGPQAVSVQAAMNRPAFANSLTAEWLPEIPDVLSRLQDTETPARVADWCCGVGWSSIALAEAFPHITVDGYDSDTESIAAARRNAAERGVSDRAQFEVADVSAADDNRESDYDVGFVFEAIHDLALPIEALANYRKRLKPGAALVVMDENVAEHLTAPGNEVERFLAAASVVWCVPQGYGPGSQVVGAIMRPHLLADLALKAGFSTVDTLPIEHPFWRFYRLQS